MAMPAVQDKLKTMGFEPTYHPIDDWTAYVTKDIGRMREDRDACADQGRLTEH